MSAIDFNKAAYFPLEGSYRETNNATRLGDLDPRMPISVTLLLRYEKDPGSYKVRAAIKTREQFAAQFHASEADIQLVEAFAGHFGLNIIEELPEQRLIHLHGTVDAFERAFRVQLSTCCNAEGIVFRGRIGNIHLPEQLLPVVEAVFGLDDRPAAAPKYRIAKKDGQFIVHSALPGSFYPNQLSDIYGFPKKGTGAGQSIAIIELGGGYRIEDINTYFKQLKLPIPRIIEVLVDGGTNAPTTADSADAEVMLDIEVTAAIAPDAAIVVYFAPNTDKGFFNAIQTAIHDTTHNPTILSISWGASEKNWTEQSLKAFNEAFQAAAMLGVTVCAAAGDNGSADGEQDGKVHVDFPASSPFVLGCGGTTLTTKDKKVESEIVWHNIDGGATGGGVSEFFPKPNYQDPINVPVSLNNNFAGRGVPDIAANADPGTGYRVRVDGQDLVIGGTSAVAPLMAGLIARINEQKGKPVGFIHPKLYSAKSAYQYRDIVLGDNKTVAGAKGYVATPGWDACTGWGVLFALS